MHHFNSTTCQTKGHGPERTLCKSVCRGEREGGEGGERGEDGKGGEEGEGGQEGKGREERRERDGRSERGGDG